MLLYKYKRQLSIYITPRVNISQRSNERIWALSDKIEQRAFPQHDRHSTEYDHKLNIGKNSIVIEKRTTRLICNLVSTVSQKNHFFTCGYVFCILWPKIYDTMFMFMFMFISAPLIWVHIQQQHLPTYIYKTYPAITKGI